MRGDSPGEAEQGRQVAGEMIHFGAAVTAQQLSPVEAHGTEVLIFDWYRGSLLGYRGARKKLWFFRGGLLHLRGPLQRSDSDLSSPQARGLDGIRAVVLADLEKKEELRGRGRGFA